MTSTIIFIVVVSLTAFIFILTLLAYLLCVKSYRLDVNEGKYDREIYREFHDNKRSKLEVIGTIVSYIILFVLIVLFIFALFYRVNSKDLTIDNKTILVIKSDSMADFYDEADELKYSRDLQFKRGDICIFETDFSDLIVGEVYTYTYDNIMITHRLIKYDEETRLTTFKGDNNETEDPYLISADNVIYHYTGYNLPKLGLFILYVQSSLGMWTVMLILCIMISSQIISDRIFKINKDRDNLMGGIYYEN